MGQMLFTLFVELFDSLNSRKIISNQPSEEWMNPSFNDQKWKSGKALFDNGKTRAKTLWLSKDLWVRRIFNPDATGFNRLILNCYMMITSKYINRFQSLPLPCLFTTLHLNNNTRWIANKIQALLENT